MKVICKDGGVLRCSTITVYSDALYVDDVWTVPIDAVESIEENEEDEVF